MMKGGMEMAEKVYVRILAEFRTDGSVLPRKLVWNDDKKYEIDRVIDTAPRAAKKVGGHGIRYKCRIRGQIRYIFRQGDRWFVEAE